MEDLGFDDILKTLHRLLDRFISKKEDKNIKSKEVSLPLFKGFQSPLEQWENSGNFSPGIATDKRHPNGHDGLDMRAPIGTPIKSISPGVIRQVYNDPKGGLSIVIDHANGVSSYYAHCNSVNVKTNDIVDYNTIIGTVGFSGNAHPSRGGGVPHCHLQIWQNGSLMNPSKFFPVKPYKPFNPNKEQLMLAGVKPRKEPNISS